MKNAPFGRRIGAILYDSLLLFALLFLGTIPFIAIYGGEHVPSETPSHQLTVALIIYLFFIVFWSRFGRTLGMQSWGLRIVDQEGQLPGIGACTIRFVVGILSLAALGLGFLWQLVDREGLSWHDRASGTRLRYYPRQKKAEAANDG